MAIKWITKVWEDDRLDGPRLLTMLALADYANEEGLCWPTVASLCKKTRRKRSAVYETLAQLKSERYLSEPDPGNNFQLAIPENRTPLSGKPENPQTPIKEDPSVNRQLPQAARATKPRARNPIWDALCLAVYGATTANLTKSETSDFARTAQDLTAINASPEEIAGFPKWWNATFPGAALTHRCFRLHFSRYRAAQVRTTARPMWQGDSRERD